MGMPAQDIIVNVPHNPDRLDRILNYLSQAPMEVQIVSIIVFGLLVVTFLKSDWSNFITDKLFKKKQ